MSVFAKVLRGWIPNGKIRLGAKPMADADAAYGKPRAMTGFMATLTEEQRKVALAGIEPELLGDPAKVDKR